MWLVEKDLVLSERQLLALGMEYSTVMVLTGGVAGGGGLDVE